MEVWQLRTKTLVTCVLLTGGSKCISSTRTGPVPCDRAPCLSLATSEGAMAFALYTCNSLQILIIFMISIELFVYIEALHVFFDRLQTKM